MTPPQTRPVQIKVQKRFYVFLGIIALVFIWFTYNYFKPKDNSAAQTLAQPAVTAPWHYPLSSAKEQQRFRDKAQAIQNNDSFYGKYSMNKGIPITFVAYIQPNDSDSAANYFTDNKRIYVPATFLTPGDPNAVANLMQSNSSGDSSPILLAFSKKNALPKQPSFVRVYGTIWWQSQYARPQLSIPSSQAQSVQNLPVVLIGGYDNYTSVEAQYPANILRDINATVRRGAPRKIYSLAVHRVEYSSSQTRILVTVTNSASVTQPAWIGPQGTTIDNGGGAGITCGNDQGSGSDQSSATNTGTLGSTDLNPGESLTGYIICDAVDPTRPVSLYLPDLPVRATQNTSDKIRIDVPQGNNN